MRSPESPASTRRTPLEGRTSTPFVLALDETTPHAAIGGKAAGIVALARAGFEVPPSAVVTTALFDYAVDRVVADASTLTELRESLRKVDLPAAFLDDLERHLHAIGPAPWAVRSSAIAEDGVDHSFAGQHLTVLHVETVAGVVDAIRNIWATALTEDVMLYRSRVNVGVVPRTVAVLLQPMLDPDVAGVCFTREPTTLATDLAVVCSAAGLGTRVVGGEACDTYFIERPSGYVRSTQLHENTLTTSDVEVFARVAERAEHAFGAPLDLEWARVDGRVVFLQARPITTPRTRNESVWTNSNVGEALPGVATPLTWSIIRSFSRRGFERAFGALGLDVPADYNLVGSFSGRVYLNLTQFADITSQIPLLAPETLFEMAGGGGVDLVRHQYEQRNVRAFLRQLPRTIARVALTQASMPAVAPIWNAIFELWTREFFDSNLALLTRQELAAELADLDQMFNANGELMLACASNFLMSYAVVREALRTFGHAHMHGREQDLLRGLHVPSSEPGLALLELGQIARRSRRLRRIIEETPIDGAIDALEAARHHEDVALFLDALDDFRQAFGHRAPREAELATPRWREDTAFLFDVLRGFVAAPHALTPRDLERDRQAAEDEVRSIAARAFTAPGASTAFLLLLRFVRGNARRREMLRSRVVDSLDIYRRYFLECGRRLREQGALAAADDVFYLTVEEIRAWLDDGDARELRFRVLVRRALVQTFRAQPDPPNIFVLRGSEVIDEDTYLQREAFDAESTDGLPELRGLAASAGRVTAVARVMHDPADAAKLRPGEVLVVPYADIGWTPLFLSTSAVVIELGGPLSHAAIVAREYGIPAVVNVRDVLQRVQTGDLITVDGNRGIVLLRE